MNPKTLSNFHRFGKVGKLVVTVFLVLALLVTALSLAATIAVCALPRDALTVRVTNHAEFCMDEANFPTFWSYLADNFSYSGSADPEGMSAEGGVAVTPPEDVELQTDLSFLNQSYSSATVHSQGSAKIVDALSSPAEYRSSSLAAVMVAFTLLAASACVCLFLLRRLFALLGSRESPFCQELVAGLKVFGFSLLPAALFATVGETLAAAFLSAGKAARPQIQWGLLIAFAVTMFLVTVFRYGVQLQTESDETL